MESTEFHEIIQPKSGERPVMSKPPSLTATKKFIRHIQDGLEDLSPEDAGDWVLNLMERYGARTAQPMFDMEGNGPSCSWCGMIWPLCGHHHMSEEINDDEEETT